MDVPNDFRELLECFNDHGIEYVVIGAYALAFHGAVRATGDIDLLVKPSLENAERLLAALADFGFPSLGLEPEELEVPDQVVQLGVPPVRVDIMTSISGVSWEDAWANRESGHIDQVPVYFIGREDYAANKRASGRPKDITDLNALGEEP
jgi:predicted nucleotidyltransferase